MWRDISDFAELNRRFEAAKKKWLPVESRYPLAKADRDKACEDRDILKRELQPVPAPVGFRDGEVIGLIVGFSGVVEILPEGRGSRWNQVVLNTPLVVGDVIRTRSNGRARLGFSTSLFDPGPFPTPRPPIVVNMAADTEMAISEFVHGLQERPGRVGLFDLIRGTVRYLTKGMEGGGSGYDVKSRGTVIGIRGTDVVIAHDPKRDHVSCLLRKGNVEVRSGNERRELKAGQMMTVEKGVIKPAKPLVQDKWKRLVSSMDIPQASSPQEQVPAGMKGPKTGPPSIPAQPPSSGRGKDVTRRDLPSGPQALGGETRFDGKTLFVQSAPSYNTMIQISTEALHDFHAAVEVGSVRNGQGTAGLYLTASGDPKGRPGDIFFGLHSSGLVLQGRDEGGWRDLPRQARGPAKKVLIEIDRRNGRYYFSWNGRKIAEYDGRLEPKLLTLYVGEGAQAEFRKFLVTR
jgi:hypothetical protein